MNKPIIILALAVVLLLTGAVAGWSFAKRAVDRGVIAQQKKDAKAVLEISKKEKVRIKNVERTKSTINEIPSDSCLDTNLNRDFIGKLRDGYSR